MVSSCTSGIACLCVRITFPPCVSCLHIRSATCCFRVSFLHCTLQPLTWLDGGRSWESCQSAAEWSKQIRMDYPNGMGFAHYLIPDMCSIRLSDQLIWYSHYTDVFSKSNGQQALLLPLLLLPWEPHPQELHWLTESSSGLLSLDHNQSLSHAPALLKKLLYMCMCIRMWPAMNQMKFSWTSR